jgi:hypothetical protein
MKEEDKASTSFITPFGTYCFIRMPEGLKIVGSTFSRLTKRVLESQVGRNIFTYVDDIVVASKNKEDNQADLAETFANMRDARLRLNPEKCVFGVRQGKILGYLLSHWGIEANPTKIQAIINMTPSQSAREVQRLTGRLAALNRFISKSAEHSLPFLKTLRGTKDFSWGPEQAAAFESLKQHLSELATLASPDPSQPLLLYIVASPCAVSATLIQEQDREGTTRQCPVYYVSEVLTASKCNMNELENTGPPRTNESSVLDVDEPTSKDLINGDRVFALQALDKYQVQTKAWRDNTVIPREFNEGDLVLARTTWTESRGKLEPNWDGPFIVKMKTSPSVYRLATSSGEDLEHSWNIDNLQKFFV